MMTTNVLMMIAIPNLAALILQSPAKTTMLAQLNIAALPTVALLKTLTAAILTLVPLMNAIGLWVVSTRI